MYKSGSQRSHKNLHQWEGTSMSILSGIFWSEKYPGATHEESPKDTLSMWGVSEIFFYKSESQKSCQDWHWREILPVIAHIDTPKRIPMWIVVEMFESEKKTCAAPCQLCKEYKINKNCFMKHILYL